MADKFKKIDKEYKLTDSTLNVYGFRLMTEGYLIDEYKKNPIGYYMHGRDAGVLLRWEDLQKRGDDAFGKPVINLSNPRGQQTVDEIESGFLNAASLGHFVILETSDDPALKLPGQTGPTVTKWYNRECSLVDVPGNMNSLTLFDKEGNPINLADFSKTNIQNMKQLFLTAEQLGKLNLKADTADAAAVETAFGNLVAEAARVPGLTQQLTDANAAKKVAEDALTALKGAQQKETVESLIADAIAAKKCTVEIGNQLKVDYATNPTGLKALVDAMQVYPGIVATLDAKNKEIAALVAMSYDELDKAGKLEDLKAKAPAEFAAKYKAEFGNDYEKK